MKRLFRHIPYILLVGRLPFFPLIFCVSNHIPENNNGERERKPNAKKGRGKMADERKGMVEREGKQAVRYGKVKRQERRAGKGSRLIF